MPCTRKICVKSLWNLAQNNKSRTASIQSVVPTLIPYTVDGSQFYFFLLPAGCEVWYWNLWHLPAKAEKQLFQKHEGPAFLKSNFCAKSCCSEKLLLDLPNNFSPALMPNNLLLYYIMLIINVFTITGIYREGDVGQGTCSPAVCKASNPIEANVCTIVSNFFVDDPLIEEISLLIQTNLYGILSVWSRQRRC